MTWKLRHEGSPRVIEGLTAQQVVEGLQDGLWEPTDEVMGETDDTWLAIENHPQFAEVAADLEPPPPRDREDEARLDMNPLIDVCLVLLIFFILTTSYAALQRMLESPGVTGQNVEGPPRMTEEQLKEFTIDVKAKRENGQPVIYVEGKPVEPERLQRVLSSLARPGKTALLLDIADDVNYGTEILIRDAAKGAGLQKVLVKVPDPRGAPAGPPKGE
jgi:biopolymer transport protein ExbD